MDGTVNPCLLCAKTRPTTVITTNNWAICLKHELMLVKFIIIALLKRRYRHFLEKFVSKHTYLNEATQAEKKPTLYTKGELCNQEKSLLQYRNGVTSSIGDTVRAIRGGAI